MYKISFYNMLRPTPFLKKIVHTMTILIVLKDNLRLC